MSNKLKIWRESASLILAAKTALSTPFPFNYKVLGLKRSVKTDVYANHFVFPGGNMAKNDSSPAWVDLFKKFGISEESFRDLAPKEIIPEVLKTPGPISRHISFRICAIREAFEECGILLVKSPKSSSDSSWASFFGGNELNNWQHKVHDDSAQFLNLCHELDVYPDLWALKNWSNWLTPPAKPARFNTMFYFAAFHQIPATQKDGREIQDLMWTTPEEYINMNNQLKVLLPPPQFYELSRLKTVQNIDELVKFANAKSKFGCETLWPHWLQINEALNYILPGDDLYPTQMDAAKTDVPYLDKAPDSTTKHRFEIVKNTTRLVLENLPPKPHHIYPQSSKF